MTNTNTSLLQDLDLGQGTRVRIDFGQSDTLSFSPQGAIEPFPDYFILDHGPRNHEQVEAALHARLLDALVPFLHACPNFQAKIQQQYRANAPSPMRAAIDRYEARTLH
jgi:hypothetical protein